MLPPALLALVDPDVRGGPMSPLRWTTKSTRNLAATLTTQGHKVDAGAVANLLRQEGFSLQSNAKTLDGKQNPDRTRSSATSTNRSEPARRRASTAVHDLLSDLWSPSI